MPICLYLCIRNNINCNEFWISLSVSPRLSLDPPFPILSARRKMSQNGMFWAGRWAAIWIWFPGCLARWAREPFFAGTLLHSRQSPDPCPCSCPSVCIEIINNYLAGPRAIKQLIVRYMVSAANAALPCRKYSYLFALFSLLNFINANASFADPSIHPSSRPIICSGSREPRLWQFPNAIAIVLCVIVWFVIIIAHFSCPPSPGPHPVQSLSRRAVTETRKLQYSNNRLVVAVWDPFMTGFWGGSGERS